MFDLYLITDDRDPDAIVPGVTAALEGVDAFRPGRIAVQLRAKSLPARDVVAIGRKLRSVTERVSVPLFVNGRPDIGVAIGADGIHISESGLSPKAVREIAGQRVLIGVSCHDASGVERAGKRGADFVVLGPVFSVDGKGRPTSPQAFAAITASTALPVLGLGGIQPGTVATVLALGARGIALQRAVFGAPNPADAVRVLLRSFDSQREHVR